MKLILKVLIGVLAIIITYELLVVSLCKGNVGVDIFVPELYRKDLSADYSVYIDDSLLFRRKEIDGHPAEHYRNFFFMPIGYHVITIQSSKNEVMEKYTFYNYFLFVEIGMECYDDPPYVWIWKKHYPLRPYL